jgi:hypothetical protein
MELLIVFMVYLMTLPAAWTIQHCVVMSKEIEEVKKEAVVAYFKILRANLPGGTEENDYWYEIVTRHSEPYKLGAVLLQPSSSAFIIIICVVL